MQSQLLRLLEVMDTLRSPGGCPWDAEQTHGSLLKYLLEVYPMDETFFSSAVHHGNGDFLNLLFDVYNPNVTFCYSLLKSCNNDVCKKIIKDYMDMKNCIDKISALNILQCTS